jgi:FAD/FMN-containing dehydrogenase
VQDMRDFWKTLAPFTHGFYINNAMDENVDGVRATFRGNYDRLVALKNQYDPTNLFHLNTNIEPTV